MYRSLLVCTYLLRVPVRPRSKQARIVATAAAICCYSECCIHVPLPLEHSLGPHLPGSWSAAGDQPSRVHCCCQGGCGSGSRCTAMFAVIEAPPRPAAAAPVAAPPLLQQELEQSNGTAASMSGRQQASSQASTAAAVQTGSRYCCYFVHRLLDFRVPELRALAELFGVQQQQLAIEPIPEGEAAVGLSSVAGRYHEHAQSAAGSRMGYPDTQSAAGTRVGYPDAGAAQPHPAARHGSCADLLVPLIVCNATCQHMSKQPTPISWLLLFPHTRCAPPATRPPSCAAAVYSGSDAWPLRMVTLPDDGVAAQIAGRSVLLKVGLGGFGWAWVDLGGRVAVGRWRGVLLCLDGCGGADGFGLNLTCPLHTCCPSAPLLSVAHTTILFPRASLTCGGRATPLRRCVTPLPPTLPPARRPTLGLTHPSRWCCQRWASSGGRSSTGTTCTRWCRWVWGPAVRHANDHTCEPCMVASLDCQLAAHMPAVTCNRLNSLLTMSAVTCTCLRPSHTTSRHRRWSALRGVWSWRRLSTPFGW